MTVIRKWFSHAAGVVCIVFGLAVLPAQAQEFKLGFVSIDKVLRDSDAAKSAQGKLEREFSKREKTLLDQATTLKSAVDKYEREAASLSEVQRTARQKQLNEQDQDFQRKRRQFDEDLAARKNEELQSLLEKANRVVKQIAEAERYDAILQEAVFINNKHDITDRVIKALNALR